MRRRTIEIMFFTLVFALLSVGSALAKPADNHRRGAALEVTLGTQYGPIDTSTTGGHLNVDPGCGTVEVNYMSHVIWFKFTPSATQTLTATTYLSTYDTMLAVFDGKTEVGCDDDSVDLTSQVEFEAAAGTTYYFAVGSFDRADGGDAYFRLYPAAS